MSRLQITIPSLVRIKPRCLDRLGIYLGRGDHRSVVLLVSEGLIPEILDRAHRALADPGLDVIDTIAIAEASFERASAVFAALRADCRAVVGLGGGRALDTAKYAAFLGRLPFYAVPTSLSNDGFCSPQSSLTMQGRRRSLASAIPYAVVVDTAVCLQAPDPLWWSGVGDLMAKVTAVEDWKRAFHARGMPVNDLGALLCDASVFQFAARPERDLEGVRLLATALMLNGIAMEISGSSRPASGSEHLISHALDAIARRPRLHGIQVGVATYLVSRLQGQGTARIDRVLEATGFWHGVAADPMSRAEWLEAVRRAPTIKDDFHTVLSERDWLPEVERLLRADPRLQRCVTD